MFHRGITLTLLFLFFYIFHHLLLTNQTTYDLSYKVYNNCKEYIKYNDSKKTIHYLYCYNNELGNFKIDVTQETYNDYKIGSIIRFSKPFTSLEMYNFAVNDKTKNNILGTLKGYEKILVKSSFIQAISVLGLIVSFVLILILIINCGVFCKNNE